MKNEFVKLVENSVKEDVRTGVNIAINDKKLKSAKDEIFKDVDIDQVNMAFEYLQKIKQMLEDGKVKDKDMASKLIVILKDFYNQHQAEVGEQGAHDLAYQDKVKKGLIGAKLKA